MVVGHARPCLVPPLRGRREPQMRRPQRSRIPPTSPTPPRCGRNHHGKVPRAKAVRPMRDHATAVPAMLAPSASSAASAAPIVRLDPSRPRAHPQVGRVFHLGNRARRRTSPAKVVPAKVALAIRIGVQGLRGDATNVHHRASLRATASTISWRRWTTPTDWVAGRVARRADPGKVAQVRVAQVRAARAVATRGVRTEADGAISARIGASARLRVKGVLQTVRPSRTPSPPFG